MTVPRSAGKAPSRPMLIALWAVTGLVFAGSVVAAVAVAVTGEEVVSGEELEAISQQGPYRTMVMDMRMESEGGPVPMSMESTMRVDAEAQLSRTDQRGEFGGGPVAETQLVSTADRMFVHVPEEHRQRSGGLPWLVAPLPGGAAPDAAAPPQSVFALADGPVRRIAEEEIDGVPATRYRFAADTERLSELTSARQAQASLPIPTAAPAGTDVSLDDVDVWLDESNRPVQMVMVFRQKIGDQTSVFRTTQRVVYDVPVDIPVPSDTEAFAVPDLATAMTIAAGQ